MDIVQLQLDLDLQKNIYEKQKSQIILDFRAIFYLV
jgi:hypothetical protein